MKVFVVTETQSFGYEGELFCTKGVYSTEDLADKAIEKFESLCNNSFAYTYTSYEHELDQEENDEV